jgi:hypothetical protein
MKLVIVPPAHDDEDATREPLRTPARVLKALDRASERRL